MLHVLTKLDVCAVKLKIYIAEGWSVVVYASCFEKC